MIRLKKAENVEEVDYILRDPELWDRIAEDGINKDSYVTEFNDSQIYLMIMDDDKPIGLWNLYALNSVTLNIHCNILKEYRWHAITASILILEWFINDCPKQYAKLNAEIPFIYPEVYHHTKKFGFKDEGINRKSIIKKGQLVDQWRLGITKEEVENILNVF